MSVLLPHGATHGAHAMHMVHVRHAHVGARVHIRTSRPHRYAQFVGAFHEKSIMEFISGMMSGHLRTSLLRGDMPELPDLDCMSHGHGGYDDSSDGSSDGSTKALGGQQGGGREGTDSIGESCGDLTYSGHVCRGHWCGFTRRTTVPSLRGHLSGNFANTVCCCMRVLRLPSTIRCCLEHAYTRMVEPYDDLFFLFPFRLGYGITHYFGHYLILMVF